MKRWKVIMYAVLSQVSVKTCSSTSRNDLIQQAKKNKADNDIINLPENIVGDTFNSPAEVSKAIREDDQSGYRMACKTPE